MTKIFKLLMVILLAALSVKLITYVVREPVKLPEVRPDVGEMPWLNAPEEEREPPKPLLPPVKPPPVAPSELPPRPQPRSESAMENPVPGIEKPPRPAALPLPIAELELTDQELYQRFSAAIIQIFCRTSEEIFAASGVIINERGLVLTNAHVAEVIKKVGETNCQARHGNPADPFAKIKIVFTADTTLKIPETKVPQRDVAFLALSDATEPFSVAVVDLAPANYGQALRTLGYPSEFLESINTSARSHLVFSLLRIDGLADVDGDPTTAEGYVFRGGLVLQQGSSGTALFSPSGKVIGIIFATTKGKTTDDREGLALMMPYVDRILQLERGQGLAEFIAEH